MARLRPRGHGVAEHAPRVPPLLEGPLPGKRCSYTPEDACVVKPFYLGILTAHHILYDRDGFFQSLLSNLQAKLDALGAERFVDEEGYEYWLLKKDWKPGDVVEL